MRKPTISCLLFVLIFFISGFSGASAASEIVIPGLQSNPIVEARVDGELLLLKAANGRLYSVPLSYVELADFCFLRSNRDPSRSAGPSLEDILRLIREGVSAKNIRTFIDTFTDPLWRLELTADDLVALKQAGASEELIQYLMSLESSRPGTTTIPWGTPFSPRKELPPEAPTKKSVSSADADVQGGIPYYPYVYPGYGYSCPTYPIYPVYPVHPIEKPDRPNRPMPRPFFGPRPSNPTVASPYSRTLSASRGNQLWIRWSLPRAGGYARSHGEGAMNQAVPSSRRNYATPLTGTSRGSMQPSTGPSNMGNRGSTGGARATGARSFRGSSGTRSAFSRSKNH
jgi:hypothetical protein